MLKRILSLVLILTTVLTFGIFVLAKEEENMVQLHSCDGKMGSFTVDRNEKVEGTASWSYTFARGTKSFNSQVTFDPIDATGTDTLAMEIYVSDPNMFNHMTELCLEITSSGSCDHQENAWQMHTALNAKKLEKGWNTVYFYLEDSLETDGACDLSAINYIRIFGFFDGDALNGEVIKLDDVRMIHTGGYDYSDVFSEIVFYNGDHSDVNIKISGMKEPDLAHRHDDITVSAGLPNE